MCHPGDPCRFAPMPCPAVTTSARVLLCLENTSACSMKSLLNEKLAQLQTYLLSNTIQRTRGVTPQDSVNKQHAIAYLWTKISFITAMFQHLRALLACCLGSGRTYIHGVDGFTCQHNRMRMSVSPATRTVGLIGILLAAAISF